MDQDTKEKTSKFLSLYFDCVNKAAEDFKDGRPVNTEALHAIHETVRIIHHLKKLGNPEVHPIEFKTVNVTGDIAEQVLKTMTESVNTIVSGM